MRDRITRSVIAPTLYSVIRLIAGFVCVAANSILPFLLSTKAIKTLESKSLAAMAKEARLNLNHY